MKNEIYRDALQNARKKNAYLAIAVLFKRRSFIKAVAETLGVAHSKFIVRQSTDQRKRESHVEADDSLLLPLIREIVDSRPKDDYGRNTVLLNHRFSATGAPGVNHSRTLRILKLHGLPLQAHTDQRIEQAHDGAVRAMRPNIKW